MIHFSGIKLKPRRRHKNANDFKLCYFVSPFVDFHAIWLFNENKKERRDFMTSNEEWKN